MNTRSIRFAQVLISGCAWLVSMTIQAGDPVNYFRSEDATDYKAAIASITDLQHGELYSMQWQGDYHLDRILDAGCTNSMEAFGAVCTKVLDNAPMPKIVTGFGCSAFAATNSDGDRIVGRNFDYRYPMAHVVLYTPRAQDANRQYASVGTVDAGFAGFNVSSLTNLTDQTRADYPWHAVLFPYLCMDGMNEAGFMVTVLSLDARPDAQGGKTRVTEQFAAGHTNIVPSVAIRYLLDHAGSTAEGVSMLTNFNMFAASGPGFPVQANYHFLLSDRSGDTRVVEWLPPATEGGSWIPFVTNATEVTNFYLADGYGHGSNRWEILRHALAWQKGHLEEDEAMCLCRAVSQKKGAEQTSWTHWSVVYNLTDLSANLATLGNYDEIFPIQLKKSGGWEIGAPRSARPTVETDLTQVSGSTTDRDKVYTTVESPKYGTSRDLVPTLGGACVSAVNRLAVAHDGTNGEFHVIAKANDKCHCVFYADIEPDNVFHWVDYIVAGLNDQGLSARIVRLREERKGDSLMPSSVVLYEALINSTSIADVLGECKGVWPMTADRGILFTDAKGNVAIWPEGAELLEDDASEMVRNSLDLRKGIYEIDGDGRGQFDELPGLLRLAATDKTRAIVSMGYGHLDVMLPGTNRIWRMSLEGANIPVYGIVANPTVVPHTTAKLTYADDSSAETNNQGRVVALTNALMKVTYTVDAGYFFQNSTSTWSAEFRVGPTLTPPPAPKAPWPYYSVDSVAVNGTVEVMTNGHHAVEAGGLVKAQDKVTILATADTYYSFVCWKGTDAAGNDLDFANVSNAFTTFTMPLANVTLAAEFKQTKVPVTYDATDGGYSDSGKVITRTETIAKGYGLPAEPPTRRGYLLTGWFTGLGADAAEIVKGDAITNLVPHTLYARWKPVFITVHVPTVQYSAAKVFTNGVHVTAAAGGSCVILTNEIAEIVYTAEAGCYFADGTAISSSKLDTSKNPVEIASSALPAAGKPSLKLGVVAQRYPWNGIVDVDYKATFWPAGKQAAVEVTLGGQTVTQPLTIAGAGTISGAAAVDLRELFGETRGKATFNAVMP